MIHQGAAPINDFACYRITPVACCSRRNCSSVALDNNRINISKYEFGYGRGWPQKSVRFVPDTKPPTCPTSRIKVRSYFLE